jgi:uncharacterized protein (TIGR03437 family)
MQLLRIALAMAALAASIGAQQPKFDVPLTHFVGAGGGNVSPFASPKAVVVGPGGDIWIAGVSQGHGLPIIDPDGRIPSEEPCYAPGGEPPSPFEPGIILDPCSDLFAMRLAADGSGPRFVKYLGGSGYDILAGAAVDINGNLYLVGTHPRSGQPSEEDFIFKVSPDGGTVAEGLDIYMRAAGVGVDSRGTVYRASYLGRNRDGIGPGPNETWSMIAATPEGQREAGYGVHLNRKPNGNVRVEDIAVGAEGWAYVCGVMRFPDFEITWPLAVDPEDKDGDIFVAAINPQGEVAWTTSYGGSGAESSPKIVLSATGEVVVAGRTTSADLPLQSSNAAELTGNNDFFLFGVEAAAGRRLYSGYLGFPSGTSLRDVASGPDGAVYLSGTAMVEQDGKKRPMDLLLKINREGELVREAQAGALAIAVADDGKVITVGATKSGLLDAGGFLYGPQSVYAAFLDLDSPNDQKPWLAAVLNAGDSVPAVLSPGAVVSLYGERLGPAEGMAAPVEEGKFPTQAGGVRVLVGDSPAPLLYVSATQINAVLPFDLGEDPMAQVVVERDGVRGNVFAMTVVEAAPGPFQQAPSNASFGAILNQDGTLNSPANPAPAGSIVALWATGLGRFSPPLADGQIVGTTGPFPALEAEISVEFGEIPAEIRYAGAAPGLAAGIAQINFVIPAGLPPGAVWLQIRAGERQSYPFTYLAVRP